MSCLIRFCLTWKIPIGSVISIFTSPIPCIHCLWAAAWQNQQNDVRPAKTDQPCHPPNLIRFFTVCLRAFGSVATHKAHNKDSDQTGQMPRLLSSLCWAQRSFCWFCCAVAQIILGVRVWKKQDSYLTWMSILMLGTTKPTKSHACPANTQISLHNYAVWSESLLSKWRSLAPSKDAGYAGWSEFSWGANLIL